MNQSLPLLLKQKSDQSFPEDIQIKKFSSWSIQSGVKNTLLNDFNVAAAQAIITAVVVA